MAMKGRGPSAESLREQYDHSWEHRGDSGMFGHYFTEDVEEWSPADDENEVGIVPFLLEENSKFRKLNPDLNRPVSDAALKANDGWVYKLSLLVHGNVGPNKDRIVCPRTLKQQCPICELRDELRNELAKLKAKGRTDTELEERVGQLGVSKRALYNMISFNSRKDKERGLMVWAAPHASIEDVIVDRARDKRSGEYKYFSVLEENWNVYFRKTGKGLNTEYTEVDVLDRRKEDRLTEEEAAKLLDSAWVLDDIVEVKGYDELYELLHGVKPSEAAAALPGKQELEKEEEDRPRGRRGVRDDSGPAADGPEAPAREARRPARQTEQLAEGQKECFSVEFNQRPECEDCPSDTFKACMKATDDAVKVSQRAARGSEDHDAKGRDSRGGRGNRK